MRYLLLLLSLMLLGPPLAAQGKTWVGKRIITKRDGIQYGVSDAAGKQVYHGELTFLSYQALGDQDGWVKVEQYGKAGWFDKEDAVVVDDAVEYFSKIVSASPRNEKALMRRAEAWQWKGELEIALKDWSELIRLDPRMGAYWNNRGNTHAKLGKYKEAISDYTESIRLKPDEADTHNNRAAAYLAGKEWKKTIEDASEAIRLRPTWDVPHDTRAQAWVGLKEFDRAVDNWTEAIKKAPAARIGAEYLRRRGGAWLFKKEHELARGDFDEVLKKTPDDLLALGSIAWHLAVNPSEKFRDGKRAVELARKACELTRWKNGFYVDILASALAETGDFPEALRYQKQALEDKEFVRHHEKAARRRLALYEKARPFRENADGTPVEE